MKPSPWLFACLAQVLAVAAGSATAQSLDEGRLRNVLVGNTVTFAASDLSRVKAYIAPGGELRGRHAGEAFSGSWSITDDRLCLDVPGSPGNPCNTVVRRGDQQLQFFTSVGEPAGHVSVESGNPAGF